MVKKTPKKNQSSFDASLAALQHEVLDITDKYKRVLADYQNQERRFKEAESQTIKFANYLLISRLISVLDQIELAQKHLQDAGLALVIDNFLKILAEEGVVVFDPTGTEFDPHTMECTDTIADQPHNQVIVTSQKGYLYHDKVVRPAQVSVGSLHIDTSK
jgi:molecular chaperone GrpE